jgi:hypothetical protein
MKIYHYASVDSWRDIKKGSWQSAGNPGLGASRRVYPVNYNVEGGNDGAVFGLLEAEPANWVHNTEYPVAWEYLRTSIGRLLLTYEPTEEIILKSFIIDWSHKERVLHGHKDDVDTYPRKAITHEDRLAAEKAYWASRVPLADYIDHPKAVADIVLPEVISMCNIPLSVIEIADVQPALKDMSPIATENLLFAIERNPELEALSAHIA